MSELVPTPSSPFIFDFMEDFSNRPELTTDERNAGASAFGGLVTELRSKFGDTNEHHPVADAGACLWLNRQIGDEAWQIIVASYDDTDAGRGVLPYVEIQHMRSGRPDFDYLYELGPKGVERKLYMDYVSEFSSPEDRFLESIFSKDPLKPEGFPDRQTNGITGKIEIEALKAFLLEAPLES